MRTAALALLLVACQRSPARTDTPGDRLESAAVARGLVVDAAKAGLVGSWASETDRVCVVPAGSGLRLGASVDYGEGQACAASGEVERGGDQLTVRFGDCRFGARFDGDRIIFPARLPEACARFCAGRASLSALSVERLSASVSEAVSLRDTHGRALCGG